MKEWLIMFRDLVPESKVGIAHGQMTERQLETEMIDFMKKEYDVLVCTTIIETGMDISKCKYNNNL